MLFSKKWLKNHPQFLLHFLIHIDVLMSFRKFELIPMKIFKLYVLKNCPWIHMCIKSWLNFKKTNLYDEN